MVTHSFDLECVIHPFVVYFVFVSSIFGCFLVFSFYLPIVFLVGG
jgi:hypothetical protein